MESVASLRFSMVTVGVVVVPIVRMSSALRPLRYSQLCTTVQRQSYQTRGTFQARLEVRG